MLFYAIIGVVSWFSNNCLLVKCGVKTSVQITLVSYRLFFCLCHYNNAQSNITQSTTQKYARLSNLVEQHD
jgi:restriction endonuclease S subunit